VKTGPETTDEYLAALPSPSRETLEAVRDTIRSVASDMEERLSSGAPFFWHAGRRAVGLGAARSHLSFYIMHGAVLKTHARELAAHDASRTVVRFTHEKPLPAALIRKLVRARIAEIERGRRHRTSHTSEDLPDGREQDEADRRQRG
jgi:uncharacterized protein YdhG (YjbR/CyaY superfamily)